jgi:8-oxo-dGTP pyrophosphatase MutT (NUDIX family)/GNAT superfamily N-acetyltransferase
MQAPKKLWYSDATSGSRFPSKENPDFDSWHQRYYELLAQSFGGKNIRLQPVKIPVDTAIPANSVKKPERRDTYLEMLRNGEPLPRVFAQRTANGDSFYIPDGSHRLDAAKMHGAKFIDGYEAVEAPEEPEPPAATAVPVDSTGKLQKDEGAAFTSAPEPESHAKLPKRVRRALDAVRAPGVLTDDLLSRDRFAGPKRHPMTGHCYVASEAMYHLINGPETGWQACVINHENDRHWFLRHQATDTIVDPTFDQFETPVPYHLGRGIGFLTGNRASRRGQQVIDRARGFLHKTEDADGHRQEGPAAPRRLSKAIADIPLGKPLAHNPRTGETLHDYSHVLPLPARSQYRLLLRTQPRTKTITAHVEQQGDSATPPLARGPGAAGLGVQRGAAGMWTGNWEVQDGQVQLHPWETEVATPHRKRGLGLALYEAALTHAKHTLGATRVSGDYHSTAASRVHRKLARKHGLDYFPEKRRDADEEDAYIGDYDGRFAPYEYMLKSEGDGTTSIADLARRYTASAGLPAVEPSLENHDESYFQRAADAYGQLQHRPDDPQVKEAYDALKRETMAQYDFLMQNGYKFQPAQGNVTPLEYPTQPFVINNTKFHYVDDHGNTIPNTPYGGCFKNLYGDILHNKNLTVFTGGAAPSTHPLAERIPNHPLGTFNNVFRAVHDIFGHAQAVERWQAATGNGDALDFGHHGEDHAYRSQAGMFSPAARRALASETRGQNSAFHFGPNGRHNRANPTKAIYPDQKAGFLPPEFEQYPTKTPAVPKPPSVPNQTAFTMTKSSTVVDMPGAMTPEERRFNDLQDRGGLAEAPEFEPARRAARALNAADKLGSGPVAFKPGDSVRLRLGPADIRARINRDNDITDYSGWPATIERHWGPTARGHSYSVALQGPAGVRRSVLVYEPELQGMMAKSEPDHSAARGASVWVESWDGKVLWGRRRNGGKWTLPGGHLEPGEEPSAGAVRELWEEAGLQPDVLYALGAANGGELGEMPVFIFKAIAHGEPTGENDPDREVAEWKWVDCSMGVPAEIMSNLAHQRNVVLSYLGLQGDEMKKSDDRSLVHYQLRSFMPAACGNTAHGMANHERQQVTCPACLANADAYEAAQRPAPPLRRPR